MVMSWQIYCGNGEKSGHEIERWIVTLCCSLDPRLFAPRFRQSVGTLVAHGKAGVCARISIKTEWEPLLRYLTDRDAIIVIDEFPYLIESNEGLPSIIQHLWDTAVDESQATLVLTSSAVGMIHTHVLDGGAPLYGRVSQTPNGRLELTQLPFRSIHEFVPSYDPEARVLTYGVFGGTPRYLAPLDPSQSLGENITRLLCDPDGSLHDEPEAVLQMELTEVNAPRGQAPGLPASTTRFASTASR